MAHPHLADFIVDLASMIADSAQSCTWAPGSGSPSTISAAVREIGPDVVNGPEGLGATYQFHQARWIKATVLASYISGEPSRDVDTLTVDSLAYIVREARPVFAGAGWLLFCSREEGR